MKSLLLLLLDNFLYTKEEPDHVPVFASLCRLFPIWFPRLRTGNTDSNCSSAKSVFFSACLCSYGGSILSVTSHENRGCRPA